MRRLSYFILLAFAVMALTQAAIAAEKAPVKINYVTGSLLVDKKSGHSGDLNSISFSIENAATRPLEWVRLRVTTRSPAGALLQTETFEEELGKNPIGSREARRVTRYMSIDGFLIGGKQGSIDIDVVDYRLSPEGGWLLLIPPSRDISSETGYFDSIRRSIELTWKYPELALRYGLQGRLLLEFSLLDNGDLESVKIVRSSGSNLLDEEALRAVKAAVCMFALFAVSNIAIVAGYYNTSLGVSLVGVKWVYESIPVFKASIALTVLLPINIVLAFFTSRGKYEAYTQELLVLSLTIPLLVILVILPGDLEKPRHLQLNLFTLIFIAVGAQLFFSWFLAKRAWIYGGRDIDT